MHLPCADQSSTRQRKVTRQTNFLPCVTLQNARQTPGTRHPCFFDVSQQRKHTVKIWHTANTCVCRVPKIKHSANTCFAVCLSGAHGKHVGKNLNLPSKIFLLDTYNVCYFILNFAIFHMKFAIFSTLVSLIEFLGD